MKVTVTDTSEPVSFGDLEIGSVFRSIETHGVYLKVRPRSIETANAICISATRKSAKQFSAIHLGNEEVVISAKNETLLSVEF